jgi:hypothetical protein
MGIIKNQKGIFMLGELIALGIVMTMIHVAMNYFDNSRRHGQLSNVVASRNKVLSTMKTLVPLPSTLRNSINRQGDKLPDLFACTTPIVTFAPGLAGDCQHGAIKPFILFSPIVTSVNVADLASGSIAGPPTQPGRYDLMGAACIDNTKATPSCPLEAVVQFRALCPPSVPGGAPAPTCDVAESIEILYSVGQAEGLKEVGDLGGLGQLGKVSGRSLVDVKSITGLSPSLDPMIIPPPPVTSTTSTSTSTSTDTSTSTSGSTTTSGTSGTSDGSSGTSTSSGSTSTTTESTPPPPITCAGNTVQVGPYSCACPGGWVLVDPVQGMCKRIS